MFTRFLVSRLLLLAVYIIIIWDFFDEIIWSESQHNYLVLGRGSNLWNCNPVLYTLSKLQPILNIAMLYKLIVTSFQIPILIFWLCTYHCIIICHKNVLKKVLWETWLDQSQLTDALHGKLKPLLGNEANNYSILQHIAAQWYLKMLFAI